MNVKPFLMRADSCPSGADRSGACAEITTLWCRGQIRCEVASIPSKPCRILLWVGARLVVEQAVTSWNEVIVIARELQTGFASVST